MQGRGIRRWFDHASNLGSLILQNEAHPTILSPPYGDILRVVLSKPEDDSEFQVDTDEGESQNDDDAPAAPISRGDELDTDDLMITIRTIEDRVLINAPFPCKIVELNGDVEDNSDLVNEDAYQDGWCMIVRPHEWDEDMYLDESEYIEYLNEI